MAKSIKLSEKQIKELKKLWFVYGNGGEKHTLFNHKYIQGIIECSEQRTEYLKKKLVTEECKNEVESVINSQS